MKPDSPSGPEAQDNPHGKYRGQVHQWIMAYTQLAFRRPGLLLLGLLLPVVAALWLARDIQVEANLRALLPPDAPTVSAMREVERRYGGTDLFTIAIEHPSADTVAAIQDSLVAAIEAQWTDALFVQAKRDPSFFRRNALLYLPESELERVLGNLRTLEADAAARAPLITDLLGELDRDDADTLQEQDTLIWFDEELPRRLGLPEEVAEVYESFFVSEEGDTEPGSLEAEDGGRLIAPTPDGRFVGVVQAALERPSSDIDYVRDVLERTENLLDPIRRQHSEALRIGIEGPYRELDQIHALRRNGFIATAVSAGLVVLAIMVIFRSLGPLLLILIQVGAAASLTLGFAAVIFGRLNLYTVFIFAILLGLGIDFSIHLLGHARRLTREGLEEKTAMAHALSVLSRPLILSALTTGAGFLTLLLAEFPGFHEFGVIASAGVAFSLLSTWLLAPPLASILGSLRSKAVSAPPLLLTTDFKAKSGGSFNAGRRLDLAALVLVLIGIGLAAFIPRLGFEYDFARLRDTASDRYESIPHGEALGSQRRTSQPIILLAQSQTAMDALHDSLLKRVNEGDDPYLRSFLTLRTFAPHTEEQRLRMEVIREIGNQVRRPFFDHATGEDARQVALLRELSDTAAPFDAEELPDWALDLLRERDGSYGRLGFIYAGFQSSNALEAMRVQEAYADLRAAGEELTVFSSSFIYSEIVTLVREDSRRMAWWISAVLVITLVAALRDIRLVTACLAGLGLGALWTVGWMGALNLKIDPFNLIAIPMLFGICVDAVIHLSLAWRRRGSLGLKHLYRTTGMLVVAASITTAAGYAGMMATTHQGIASIGKLAVLGIVCCLLSSLIATPWVLRRIDSGTGSTKPER